MPCQKSTRAETIDELLSLLANSHCRATLDYFQDSSEDTATVETLATELSSDAGDHEHVAVRLHHDVLPRLAAADVVTYDGSTGTVRYLGHTELEAMLDGVRAATQRVDWG